MNKINYRFIPIWNTVYLARETPLFQLIGKINVTHMPFQPLFFVQGQVLLLSTW